MLLVLVLVLATLVSPNSEQSSSLAVTAYCEKKHVVSRSTQKKRFPLPPYRQDKLRQGRPCPDCVVIRSQTGDPTDNPPSPYGSVGNVVPRYGAQFGLNIPAIVVYPHPNSFWAPGQLQRREQQLPSGNGPWILSCPVVDWAVDIVSLCVAQSKFSIRLRTPLPYKICCRHLAPFRTLLSHDNTPRFARI